MHPHRQFLPAKIPPITSLVNLLTCYVTGYVGVSIITVANCYDQKHFFSENAKKTFGDLALALLGPARLTALRETT